MAKDACKSKQKNPKDFNWAWQCFLNGKWKQFECTECILLEMQYYAYKNKQIKQVQTIKIANGTVDLETCMIRLNDGSE